MADTKPLATTVIGLVLVSVPAIAWPVGLAVWAISNEFAAGAELAAAVVGLALTALLLARLWRSALATEHAPRRAGTDGWIACALGALVAFAPLAARGTDLMLAVVFGGLLAAGIIWLGALSHERGGGPAAIAGMGLAMVGIGWLLFGLFMLWVTLNWLQN